MRWSFGFGPFRVYGGHSRRRKQRGRSVADMRARARAEEARQRARVEAMTTEEYGRAVGLPDEQVQQIIQRSRDPYHTPEVDADIARLESEMTYTARLKFPDGTEQACCETGHPTREGARRHAEQIAAGLGYGAHEGGAEETPP